MEYDDYYDEEYEILDEIRTILENPQDVINAFNTFYHQKKYRYLDVLFEKGLSYDLGVIVFSMYDFKPVFFIEFVNTK